MSGMSGWSFGGGASLEPAARLSGGRLGGGPFGGGRCRRIGGHGLLLGRAASGVSFALFAVHPLCAVATNGELEGLAFDFEAAPSSGVSFDLFAVPPLCAVSACGGSTERSQLAQIHHGCRNRFLLSDPFLPTRVHCPWPSASGGNR